MQQEAGEGSGGPDVDGLPDGWPCSTLTHQQQLPSSCSHHSQECPFLLQLESFHPRLWIKARRVCQSRKGQAAEP